MTTDLDMTTHLYPEGRGIALVELAASLLHFFLAPPPLVGSSGLCGLLGAHQQ